MKFLRRFPIRRLITAGLAAAVGWCAFPVPARAAEVLYEHRAAQALSRGVDYELTRQMTDAGMLDIHALFVPLDDPYITVEPVLSKEELGLKETPQSLLTAAGAIAGTNGDFFGMAGSYSVPFGPVVLNGRLHSATTSTNAGAAEFAAFILGSDNSPLMRYMKTDIHFFNNGSENIDIVAYNKVGHELNFPTVVDQLYMTDTAGVDERFADVAKVVVKDNAVSYIARPGETVAVPPGGYAVLLPPGYYESAAAKVRVGQIAQLLISNSLNMDYTDIRAAIGGGGLILRDGQTVHDDGVAVAGRQPRTAVGVTADKQRLVILAVDGRSHSIGATHDEMAALFLRYGVTDAMHLDGGGSTTMVVRDPDTGSYGVTNTLSDGSQRRVVNALGIFDRAPEGVMERLALRLSQDKTFVNAPVTVGAAGADARGHEIALDPGVPLAFSCADEAAGYFTNNVYIPTRAGTHSLTVAYGGFSASVNLTVADIAELRADLPGISTFEGFDTALHFTGITTDGDSIPADNTVRATVVPPTLGSFSGGVFSAGLGGTGYLACEVNGMQAYVPVSVGGFGQHLPVFDGETPLAFSAHPASGAGAVSREWAGGRSIARMDYQMEASADTQAAYMELGTVALPGEPVALRLRVLGDGSGHWMRGRIHGADGAEFLIDFTQSMDFTGWETVTALLPPEAAYPITLDRVYMAALTAAAPERHTLYFDLLEALYPPPPLETLPESTRYDDPLQADLSGFSPDDAAVYDLTVQTHGQYSVAKRGGMAVVTLAAGDGGIFAADASQWARFTADVDALSPDFVVVMLDADPAGFTRYQEAELFHLMLSEQASAGRKVFVVTAGAEASASTVRDGIRYIALRDDGYPTVRFGVNGKDIRYDIGNSAER